MARAHALTRKKRKERVDRSWALSYHEPLVEGLRGSSEEGGRRHLRTLERNEQPEAERTSKGGHGVDRSILTRWTRRRSF